MSRALRNLLAAPAILSLCACSNVDRFDLPRNPNNGFLSTASIVRRLKCELTKIVSKDYDPGVLVEADDLVVGAQLDLTVTDDGSLAPTFTYTDKMFSFNAGLRYEISRAQSFTARIFIDLATLRHESKGLPQNDPGLPSALRCPDPDTLLAGDLGVVQTYEMGVYTPDIALTAAKLSGTNGVFGGSVNFIVTKNLNAVGPTYTLTHFKGPGSLAGVSEVNNDKITFAFASRSAADKVPAAVKANEFLDVLILGQVVNQASTFRQGL